MYNKSLDLFFALSRSAQRYVQSLLDIPISDVPKDRMEYRGTNAFVGLLSHCVSGKNFVGRLVAILCRNTSDYQLHENTIGWWLWYAASLRSKSYCLTGRLHEINVILS